VTKPKLIIIAGPNGSGKTSVAGKLQKHEWGKDCENINPDEIARDMFGDWNSPDAVKAAAVHATKQRQEYIAKGRSFIWETVLSAFEKISFVYEAKQNGYFIRLFFISTNDPQINTARVAHRVQVGGHTVPTDKIISRYSKSIANCGVLVPVVDRLYIYDNSVEGGEPELLFRAVNGKLQRQYVPVIPGWASVIFRSASGKID